MSILEVDSAEEMRWTNAMTSFQVPEVEMYHPSSGIW